MRYYYAKPQSEIEFSSIVDDLLGLSGAKNEVIVHNIVEYLMQHYDINKCFIDYSAEKVNSGGTYYPSTGGIDIRISYFEQPITAFGVLAHEMAHKFDDENNIMRGRVNNKGSRYLSTSHYPNMKQIVLSQKLLKFPLQCFKDYYYYTHPTEVFARKEAKKLNELLLQECKEKYKTIENKALKSNAKQRIKQIKRAIASEKEVEARCTRLKIFGPFCIPIAKFTYNQMGKKLYKQLTNNKVDKDFYDNFSAWLYNFNLESLYNESSKERLLKMAELIKDQKYQYLELQAKLQVLGFVDNSHKAVEENITKILELEKPKHRQNLASSYVLPQIYLGYEKKYIQNTAKRVLEKLNTQNEENVEFQDEIKQTDVKIEYNNSRQKEELEL